MEAAHLLLSALLLSTTSTPDADAMPAVGRAMDAWKICTATNTQKYSLSTKEPAQTVIEAGMGECINEYQAVRLALFGVGSPPDEADDILKYMVDNFRPILTAGVLRLRTAGKK